MRSEIHILMPNFILCYFKMEIWLGKYTLELVGTFVKIITVCFLP